MRIPLLLALLLLLITAGALSLLATPSIEPERPLEGPTSMVPPLGATTSDSLPQATEATTEVADASAKRAQAEAASAPRPHAPDARWLDLLAVDQAGHPVGAAEIHWRDPQALTNLFADPTKNWQEQAIVRNQPAELARLYGWSTRCDQRGRARITVGTGFVITGQSKGLFGLIEISPHMRIPADGLRLVLLPERAVQVLVLDSADQPCAHVPVKILAVDEDGEEAGLLDQRAMAITDAYGRATLANLQLQLDRLSECSSAPIDTVRTFVNLMLPGHAEPGVEVHLAQPPDQPVVLRMPPTGSVRVRVELPGLPKARDRDVAIYSTAEDFGGTLYARPGPDGWANFAHVPTGTTLAASSDACDQLSVEFEGPKFQNDRVDLLLSPQPSHISLTARILDERGNPIANTYLGLELDGEAATSLRTDESGKTLISWLPGGDAAAIKYDRARIRNGILGTAPGEAFLDPSLLVRGVTHLGDVVMRRHPLAVSGQVLCDEEPCKKPFSLYLQRYHLEPGAAEAEWIDVPKTMLEKTPDGRFALYARREPGRYRVRIRSRQTYAIQPIPIELGDEGLIVRTEAGHSLHVTAWIPSRANAWDIRVELDPAKLLPTEVARRPARSPSFQRKLGERCTASLICVPPGIYNLRVRADDSTEWLAIVEGVAVPQPEQGDPRLANIDLRDKLQLVTVRCFDPSGKAILRDGLLYRAEDHNNSGAPYRSLNGAITQFVMPNRELDHIAVLYGYQAERVRGRGPEFRLTMHPWHKAQLILPTGLDLPDQCIPVVIVTPQRPLPHTLVPHSDADRLPQDRVRRIPQTNLKTYSFGDGAALPVGKSGKVEVALSPGQHDVKLVLFRHGASRADSGATVAGVEPALIGGNTGRHVLRIPEASWRAALAKLGL